MVGTLYRRQQQSRGFTIVELLIVVVVIAILAAITIVAYNGIQDRAKQSSVQSALVSAYKALEASKIQGGVGTYPATLPSTIPAADYIYEPTASNQDYCLTQSRGTTQYFVTARQSSPVPGTCQGMIAWWPLNNNSTVDMLSTNDGVNAGGASSVGQSGVVNTGWNLPGDTTPRYVNTPLYFSPSSFTTSIWVNPDGGGPSSFSGIMSTTRDCCANYTGMQLDYNRTTLNLVGRVWTGGAGPAATIGAAAVMTAGQWKHIALTTTGTLLTLYVNGVSVGTQAYAAGTPGTSSFPLKLGGGGWTNGSHTFGGIMDDARVYNRALSADEIARMYSAGAQ